MKMENRIIKSGKNDMARRCKGCKRAISLRYLSQNQYCPDCEEGEILEILNRVGAVIRNSHIVYTSGKHGSAYVNKDAIYPHIIETSRLCYLIAKQFQYDNVKVIIAPAIGGMILSQWIAYHLSEIIKREVLSTYAEKAKNGDVFVIKRGYDKLIVGKRVLVVEDVLTTGGSAKKVIEATRAIGGYVVGLGVLCNRGGITPQDVAEPPKLFALVNVKLNAWDEADFRFASRIFQLTQILARDVNFLRGKDSLILYIMGNHHYYDDCPVFFNMILFKNA